MCPAAVIDKVQGIPLTSAEQPVGAQAFQLLQRAAQHAATSCCAAESALLQDACQQAVAQVADCRLMRCSELDS